MKRPPWIMGVVGVGVLMGECVRLLVQGSTPGAYVGLVLFVLVGSYAVWYVVTHWRRHD
jgi:hypothetical protein